MSRASAAAPSRPMLVDYVFLLAGVSLSLYLQALSPLRVDLSGDSLPPPLRDLLAFLPAVMRLPEGIVLVGPIFYATQFVSRRQPSLTALEWLWVISCIGLALLTGLAFWERSGTLPELVHPYATLWYVLFVPSMAALAAILGIAGMLRRWACPWTHTFSLVLLLWPVAPMVGILSLGKFV